MCLLVNFFRARARAGNTIKMQFPYEFTSGDCRLLSYNCSACEAATTFETAFDGNMKCIYCSPDKTATKQVRPLRASAVCVPSIDASVCVALQWIRPGCYPWNK